MNLLTALDWIMVAAYFAVVFIVAMAVSRRSETRESAEGYFLSGRNAGWFIVGSSLFASNIGAEHLVGLAGSGAAGGVAVGQFEVLASLVLLLLAWFFVPFYLKSGVFLVGLCWQRVNAAGALAALGTGFVLGLARLLLKLNRAAMGEGFLGWYAGINFLHFAILLFVVCSTVLVLVSLATPPPAPAQTAGLTLQTRSAAPERLLALRSEPAWRRTDVRLSILLAAIVAAVWLVFSG